MPECPNKEEMRSSPRAICRSQIIDASLEELGRREMLSLPQSSFALSAPVSAMRGVVRSGLAPRMGVETM